MRYSKLLAVDSSTEYLQLVLQSGKNDVHMRMLDEGLRHGENLMPAVELLLAEYDVEVSDLDGLICARGPGSFMGLRIAMSSLKAAASVLGIPLISVSTIDAMFCEYFYEESISGAQSISGSRKDKSRVSGLRDHKMRGSRTLVLPVIDAKRNRFFTCIYDFDKIDSGGEGSEGAIPEMFSMPDASRLTALMDASADEIFAVLREKLTGIFSEAISGQASDHQYHELDPIQILLTGPHVLKLYEPLKISLKALALPGVPDRESSLIALRSRPCTFWGQGMLELGKSALAQGLADDPAQGPEYIRSGV